MNPMTKQRLLYKVAFTIILVGTLISCSRSSEIKFYSLDRSNCVTVITEDTLRFVIAGDYDMIPDSNYVKLDISMITELGDGVWICWLENQGWDVIVDKAIILENRLDSNIYHFDTKLPVDKRGIPTEIKFRKENCAVFDFHSMKLSPNKGAIVVID